MEGKKEVRREGTKRKAERKGEKEWKRKRQERQRRREGKDKENGRQVERQKENGILVFFMYAFTRETQTNSLQYFLGLESHCLYSEVNFYSVYNY